MKTLSIDTNVLVRLLVLDDTEQNEIVERLFKTSRFSVLWTVLLEAEWVLRKVFKIDARRINDVFKSMLIEEVVHIERPDALARVLDLHSSGMDFAGAVHLCLTDETMPFVTFDRDLVRRAKKLIPDASVELAQ
ncbi:MAG: type II toxin-antitoxin system VapC family toxin [Alphaproteobacteria bacterium]|nr:MAG: type II toxin-antitoxin system VapC family toxin [Alphaproteobacteria bacterium]